MKQQLSGCKPVQMTELEAEFEKLKGEKKTKGGEADEEEADDDTDPYDLMDPVDILEKLPKNFYELVNTFDLVQWGLVIRKVKFRSSRPTLAVSLSGIYLD